MMSVSLTADEVVILLVRYALEQRSANVDLLLLSRDGATVYNGPLRLTVPYFLSIGVANLGCSEEALRDIVSNSDISTPLLDGQVCICSKLLCIFHDPIASSHLYKIQLP